MATANATVMFTDIRGFTARTSRDSREDLEELLQTHEALLLPVIKHFDGRVVKTIGDAFLVVFESPTNAVHCGVVIQRRLLEFNREAPDEKKIEVRVAINSGEVTLRGDDIFGEPVNICARIEGITEPNEIYFTEATYLTMQKAEVPSSEVGSQAPEGHPRGDQALPRHPGRGQRSLPRHRGGRGDRRGHVERRRGQPLGAAVAAAARPTPGPAGEPGAARARGAGRRAGGRGLAGDPVVPRGPSLRRGARRPRRR